LVQVKGKKVVALIDSGSVKCIVSQKLVNKLNVRFLPLEVGDAKILTAANETTMQVLGKVVLDVKMA
jgi:hypothetical protein